MKKLSCVLLAALLLLPACPMAASAEEGTTYYNVAFDTTQSVDDVATLSTDCITASIVDAGVEGIGEAGNGLLKLDISNPSGTATSTLTIKPQAHATIPTGQRLQFSVDFYRTLNESTNRFFALASSGWAQQKPYGLVQMWRDGAPVYDGRLYDGTGNAQTTLLYGDNETAPYGKIPAKTWYRLTINWTPASSGTDNPLEEVILTDLTNGSQMFSTQNVPVANTETPLSNIEKIIFYNIMYNKGTVDTGALRETIYYDNLVIKSLPAEQKFELMTPAANQAVPSGDTLSLQFSQEVDDSSLSGIAVSSSNFAQPEIASVSKNPTDGTKVDVTFSYPLVEGGRYTLALNGVTNADGAACETTSVPFRVRSEAPAGAYVSEDFSSLDGTTISSADTEISTREENGEHILQFKAPAANNADNSGQGPRITVQANIPATEEGILFETDYYPESRGIQNGIFYLKEGQAPWGLNYRGLVLSDFVGTSVHFHLTTKGDTLVTINDETGVAKNFAMGQWYNMKYVLKKRDNRMYGQAYIYDYETGELTVSEEIPFDETNVYNVINEIGFMQRTWGAADTYYRNLFVSPLTTPHFVSADIASETVEDYQNLSFDIAYDAVLDQASLDAIKVMTGDSEVASTKTLVADSKTVRVTVTGALPENAVVTVQCGGVTDTNYQPVPQSSFTFQTASAFQVAGCSFDKQTIEPGAVTGTVSFLNQSQNSQSAVILMAVYEETAGGKVLRAVGCEMASDIAAGDSTASVTVTVPEGLSAANASVDVMVWDSLTQMIPLCDAFSLGA